MGKTVFMFPGQGAQYTGMGKDFYEEISISRKAFETASKVTGLNMEELCFEENEKLNITEYTQIAMLTTEVAMLAALKERGIQSDVNLGLSLGEYGALVASGVMSYEDACHVVRQRGIFMDREVPAGKGAMAAVLGMEAEKIAECLSNISGSVQIANYNCPGQIVISGETGAVEEASALLGQLGAKRVLRLNVSGPFHSALLKGAGEKLGEVLRQITIRESFTPYVANYTAEYVTDSGKVKMLLEKQVYSAVKFEQSIRMLIEDGADTFIEIGPGKTLTGFLKKINREIKTFHIERPSDLDEAVEACSKGR